MAFNEQVYGSDTDTSRDVTRPDQGLRALRHRTASASDRAAMESNSWDAPDDRTVDELAADAEDMKRAAETWRRKFNPTREARHLGALAFAAATVQRKRTMPTTEIELYVVIYEAKYAQLGRAPQPTEREDLRAASRAMWNALAPLQANAA